MNTTAEVNKIRTPDTIAAVGPTPWGALGASILPTDTIDEIRVKAGLDWNVIKKPLWFSDEKGQHHPVPGKFALVRETDNEILSDKVASKYRPIQNHTILNFFRKFTEAGHMDMEHVGSLGYGKFIWALARIKKADFIIGKGSNSDEIKAYLLLIQPHKVGHSMVGMGTSARSWCWNTLQAKLRANQFRWPHVAEFDDAAIAKAEAAFGLVVDEMATFKEQALFLSKKKAKDEEVVEFFHEVLDYDPETAKKKKDGEAKEPRALPLFKAALLKAPGQEITTAKGTWWGAVNAVTYVADHQLGRDTNTALLESWLWNKADMKRKAVEVALRRAA